MAKTILHILNTNSYSGAENVAISIINELKGSDFKCIYVALDGPISKILAKNDIEFEAVSKVCRKEIKRVIRKYKPSLIHAHDFTASIISAFSTFKIPIISHIHNNSPWLRKFGVNSIVYGISCLRYKRILGVSDSVFKEYIFGGIFRKKQQVIGNPIDVKKIKDKAKTAIRQDSFDVVFLGRLAESKNPLFFIDIIKQITEKEPNIRVAMIGDGELRNAVKEKIADLRLENVITLTGFMENPYGVLKNSKLLCLPSKWEGFGLVAIEALAFGKPVVASPVGGLPTIIQGDGGFLCSTEQDFVDAIIKLLDDAAVYEERSQMALRRAETLDNIKKYIEQIENSYKIWAK